MSLSTPSPLLIDGLIVSKWSRPVFEDMRKAGLTAANCTVSIWENFRDTVANIAAMRTMVADNSDLLALIRTTDDIRRMQPEGKTGIILGFQNAQAFEDDLANIQTFFDLGVRIV